MVVTAPPVVLRTDGPHGTRSMAAALAPLCRPGDVLLLVGNLGAGKTPFAQGFGTALGVEDNVTSPTFTLVRQYPLPGGGPLRQFVHADLYRLSNRAEVADLGLAQLVEDGGVAVVEWGEAAELVLGDDWLRVELEMDTDDADARAVRLVARGVSWSDRWSVVEAAVDRWRAAA